MWNLTGDEVSLAIAAPADVIYAVIADVTRMPQLSPEVVSCEWVNVDGPKVGARFPGEEPSTPRSLLVKHPGGRYGRPRP
jgi:hypothetical protein